MNILYTPPITVFGVDPGTSTGTVVTTYTQPCQIPKIIHSSTIKYDTVIEDLIKIVDELVPDIVVVEDFAVRRSKAMGLTSAKLEVVRVIGIIKTICYIKEIPMVLQRPIDVTRATVDPEVIPILAHHERSAYKHVKYWYYTKHLQETG